MVMERYFNKIQCFCFEEEKCRILVDTDGVIYKGVDGSVLLFPSRVRVCGRARRRKWRFIAVVFGSG